MHIKISKGLNIPLAGDPEQVVDNGRTTSRAALLGSDYAGIKPRLMVEVGGDVQPGQPLFTDRHDPAVVWTAPGAGRVVEINRGSRRTLQSVVVELDASSPCSARSGYLDHIDLGSFEPDDVRRALLASGLWTAFRTRPFSRVPKSDASPRSIFVTAIDTHPLSADPNVVVRGREDTFNLGLRALTKLTPGRVFLCTSPEWSLPTIDDNQVLQVTFSGPHPAGLPGTHIHFLDPVSTQRSVWHINYQDVLAIGTLVGDGLLDVARIVSLGGTGIKRPRLIRTRIGASIAELTSGELADGSPELVSGSVLDGHLAQGTQAYLGRYHQQISAIARPGRRRLFGWLQRSRDTFCFSSFATRRGGRDDALALTSALNGRVSAMIPVEAFDEILPMDVLAVPLLRALLVGDTEQAQALGCMELDPADLALCSFVCPGKIDYGGVLRSNLAAIERDN